MRQGRRLLVGVVAALAFASPANAQIVVQNGETQPVFGYSDAIRERVFVGSDFDSDANGVNDVIAVDIIRPKATETGLKVACELDRSSYPSGIKVSKEEMAGIRLRRDKFHGEWNYTILPQPRG